jgi:hypothetical protein
MSFDPGLACIGAPAAVETRLADVIVFCIAQNTYCDGFTVDLLQVWRSHHNCAETR